MNEKSVAVRKQGEGNQGNMKLEEFAEFIIKKAKIK